MSPPSSSIVVTVLLSLASTVDALALSARPALRAAAAPRAAAPPSMQLFGPKKTPEEVLEEKGTRTL